MRQEKKQLELAIQDWYQSTFAWRHIPRANLIREFSLEEWGGCQLFVRDINNDGLPEFLWLQSLGIYKSRVFLGTNAVVDRFLSAHGQDVFCLTATDLSGNVLWQIGSPYSGNTPYLSHATEQMVAVADVDADGKTEVLALNGSDELWLLDGESGSVKNRKRLPADNFATVKTGVAAAEIGERVILVGVSDVGYPPYQYANPWLFLDSSLNILSVREFLGAGHQVAVLDADRDGQDEFFIGYQLVDTDGAVIWTVDQWRNRTIDPVDQHVDTVETCWIDGKWYAAVAGSDQQYWVDSNGNTLWSHRLPHPQYCVIGRNGSSIQVFVLNQRKGMNCFDVDGNELWRGFLPEHWPQGRPPGASVSRPIHCNVPALSIKCKLDPERIQLLYKEGGWPYVADFYGNPTLVLPYGTQYRQPRHRTPARRLNDVGLAYEAEVCDLDNDGFDEIVVYNRQHVWIFETG